MVDSPTAHYFASSPSWTALVSSTPSIQEYLSRPYQPKDVAADRAHQLVEEGDWAKDHQPDTYAYASRTHSFKTRDAAEIPVKVYTPLNPPASPLPILFVVHGGGFVQGTAVTEERWLIAPLLARLNAAAKAFVVASVEYRRAPEHRWPGPLRDCEDVLHAVLAEPGAALGLGEAVRADKTRVYLAGSSAGACLAAQLAQWARDAGAGAQIEGVLLNVPLLCAHEEFPHGDFAWACSYSQAAEPGSTLLTLPGMGEVWGLYLPQGLRDEERKAEAKRASPLLQEVGRLAPHALFVAGQDALRDEGLAYAERLKEAGVSTEVQVYAGVPHVFGEIWSLPEAQRFQRDLGDWVLARMKNVESEGA